jgi:hypothetical protein
MEETKGRCKENKAGTLFQSSLSLAVRDYLDTSICDYFTEQIL